MFFPHHLKSVKTESTTTITSPPALFIKQIRMFQQTRIQIALQIDRYNGRSVNGYVATTAEVTITQGIKFAS